MMSEKNVWETYEEQEMKEVFALAEDYKRFISCLLYTSPSPRDS